MKHMAPPKTGADYDNIEFVEIAVHFTAVLSDMRKALVEGACLNRKNRRRRHVAPILWTRVAGHRRDSEDGDIRPRICGSEFS